MATLDPTQPKSLSGVTPFNPSGSFGLISSLGGVSISGSSGGGSSEPSFAFEQVYARLIPFQYPDSGAAALAPIAATGGLVFPYNPSISEGVAINYDQIDLTHTNESYYAWKNTENVKITISDATWTCDTFENAIYALSVLHFLRSMSFMDFGRFKTGRPPSPMWFSAYGNYAFNRVPVLMNKADWTFPNDVDYVGVPEPGTDEYKSGVLQTNRGASGKYTWLPVIFKVSSISLIVQHSPTYWTNWSLDDYWTGKMLERGGFHITGPTPGDATTTTTAG